MKKITVYLIFAFGLFASCKNDANVDQASQKEEVAVTKDSGNWLFNDDLINLVGLTDKANVRVEKRGNTQVYMWIDSGSPAIGNKQFGKIVIEEYDSIPENSSDSSTEKLIRVGDKHYLISLVKGVEEEDVDSVLKGITRILQK